MQWSWNSRSIQPGFYRDVRMIDRTNWFQSIFHKCNDSLVKLHNSSRKFSRKVLQPDDAPVLMEYLKKFLGCVCWFSQMENGQHAIYYQTAARVGTRRSLTSCGCICSIGGQRSGEVSMIRVLSLLSQSAQMQVRCGVELVTKYISLVGSAANELRSSRKTSRVQIERTGKPQRGVPQNLGDLLQTPKKNLKK